MCYMYNVTQWVASALSQSLSQGIVLDKVSVGRKVINKTTGSKEVIIFSS